MYGMVVLLSLILLGPADITNWQLNQYGAARTWYFPSTSVPDDGYVIRARACTQSDFESFWGVTLGSNVLFFSEGDGTPDTMDFPVINGDETFSLYDNTGAFMDTVAVIMLSGYTYQRDATDGNTWTQVATSNANPGSGANGGYAAGVVFTEVSDASGAGNYIYEFVELYNDAGGDPPPDISNLTQIPASPDTPDTTIIYAKITDNSGLEAESLYYKVNSLGWDAKGYDSVKVDTFFFSIDNTPYNPGDTITYYVWAMDDSSNTSSTGEQSYILPTESGGTSGDSIWVLFDYTKNQTAGDADWIIDSDYPIPDPYHPSSELDWDRAISSWAFGLDTVFLPDGVSHKYVIRTLTSAYGITYGDADNPYDLSNFDIYIVDEPQNQFSLAEKQAIFDFVRNGGGLFMVADHNSSDRDNDGWDSPNIWNDFGAPDSFGIYFHVTGDDANWISKIGDVFGTGSIADSILNLGPNGKVTSSLNFYGGTTITVLTENNPTVEGIVWVTGANDDADSVMFAAARFGQGKVVGLGDSSPTDDGTGASSDDLYDNWHEGGHPELILNATWWLFPEKQTTGVELANFSAIPSAGEVKLYWKFTGEVFGIRILRDSDIVADISPNTGFYRDVGVPTGKHIYTLKYYNGSVWIKVGELPVFVDEELRVVSVPSIINGDVLPVNTSNLAGERLLLALYDISGRKVKELFNRRILGKASINCSVRGLPSGSYFLVAEYAGIRNVERVVIVK